MQLFRQAQELEASFLAEMLENAGLDGTGGQSSGSAGFGGGIGEDHFSSFLRAEQARLMVERGGIGLAEEIYTSLERRDAR